MKRVLLTALLFSALFAGNAFAGFIINVEQVGTDLKFTYSGSMQMFAEGSETDSNRVGYGGTSSLGNDIFRVYNGGTIGDFKGVVTPTFSDKSDFFVGTGDAVSGSLSAGATNFVIRTTSVPNELRFSVGAVGVGTKTVSGSFTVAGRNFASIGYTSGESRTWNWTQNNQNFVTGNTLTITAVPEPSSIALVSSLVAGLTVLTRRRRQA
jgi:hypothetical protein